MFSTSKFAISCKEKMKLFLICVLTIVATKEAQCAMSEAQMQSAVKLMRNVCQPKTKVTMAQIEGLHKGEFPDTPEIKCYAECTLRTAQILKDGKMNMDSLRTQMATLPKQYSEPGLVTAENCKNSIQGADKCESAYSFYKCFYNDNPANFFLP